MFFVSLFPPWHTTQYYANLGAGIRLEMVRGTFLGRAYLTPSENVQCHQGKLCNTVMASTQGFLHVAHHTNTPCSNSFPPCPVDRQ